MIDKQISHFKNTRATECLKTTVTIGDFLNGFKNGDYKEIIDKVRSAENSDIKSHYKLQLPSIAFQGIFENYRKKEQFIEASGVIIIDIDDCEDDLEDIKEDISLSSDHALSVLVSPSGNGIKVLHLVMPELINADNYRSIGKEVSKQYEQYGKVDYLSVTDTLIATYDPKIIINEDAVPEFVYVKDVIKKTGELEEYDESVPLWEDVEDFFDTALCESIIEKTNNNYHFIQVAMLDLAKFGFTHPKEDLSFVIDYAENQFGVSSKNKERFLQIANIAKEYPQTRWAYRLIKDEGEEEQIDYSQYLQKEVGETNVADEDVEEDAFVDYSTLFEKVLATAREGNRVGYEISYEDFSDIFRFKGSGILTITGIPTCFDGDQKIITKSGIKKIRDIVDGDEVLSHNVNNGRDEYKEVEHLLHTPNRTKVFEIMLKDGTSIKATKNHKFWNGFKYVTLGDILKSPIFTTLNPTIDNFLSVCDILSFKETEVDEVFDISVKDNNNYYLSGGSKNILVSNCGKTEFTDAAMLDLARLYGHQTLIAGFEQSPEEHILKLMRKLEGRDIRCETWLTEANEPRMQELYNFITSKIFHLDVFKIGGSITTILEEFAKKILYLRNNGGDPKYVVIDPFNLLSIKGKFSGHEKVEEILRKINEFSHKMGVLVILVAHPFKMKKDEKTGEYEVPDFYSIKGSSAFYEMSYHGLVVHRLPAYTMVKVLKVKQNNLGERDAFAYFLYDLGSGRYIPCDGDGNEQKGTHKDTDWLEKALELENNK